MAKRRKKAAKRKAVKKKAAKKVWRGFEPPKLPSPPRPSSSQRKKDK